MPKKDLNLFAARRIIAEVEPCTKDEKLELENIFAEDDRALGEIVYLLKSRKGYRKLTIANLLSGDIRSLQRFFGTISLSPFLTAKIDDTSRALIKFNSSDLPAEVDDNLPFDQRKAIKTKMVMETILDSTLTDPTKFAEATLDEAASAYEKLYKIDRLEQGKSTENRSLMVTQVDPVRMQAEKDELAALTKMVADLTKTVEKHA